MKRSFSAILLLSCLSGLINAQVIFKQPLSQRQTGYDIDAALDTRNKVVNGKMKAFWVNMSDSAVGDVRMHLYLNAFRNSKSTFFSEEGRMMMLRGSSADSGWIDIKHITDSRGNDLAGSMHFISPDDGNPDDRTVIRIDLPQPCSPGDTVLLDIDFISKLPGNIIRTGYSGDFYFVAQWFPKFGVYETKGMRNSARNAWNCHQFHSNSEFYSNHSVYDVRITVPQSFVVGTGGLLLDEFKNSDSTKTLKCRAEDIVDFAWTAWPGYAVFRDQWRHVNITLLMPPERSAQVNRQMTAVKNALEYMDAHVGPYPWPHLTVVDPPFQGAGGMEYTTLFTSMSFYGIPKFIRLPEMVTMHEFVHSYFMGILASNEFEEAWMDEGMTTYFEGKLVDHFYGGMIEHPLLRVTDESIIRSNYKSSLSRQVSTNREFAWNYPHGTYAMMSYHKPGAILQTLEGIIGEEMMFNIFHEYYRQWAFGHPSGKDFIDVANEVFAGSKSKMYGPDLNWFFNQTLYGSEICDFRVEGFQNRLVPGTDSVYNSSVEIERIGGLRLPVEILVHFDDSTSVTEKWDGAGRFADFKYAGKRKVDWVKVDPDFRIRMDVNYINNSMTDNPDRVPVRRIRNKLIAFLQFFMFGLML